MNIDTVIVSCIAAIAGAVTAYFGFRGKQSDNDTKITTKTLEGLLSQVADLTKQVGQLREENAEIKSQLNHAVRLLDKNDIDFSEGRIVES
ncbi:hypothetical protein ESZ50_04645 [Weissella muntiaci]|uniref:Uncharacterized protein n=1 Tax=Weissella muntiaci TaxID=2508881 RepID=A0A6C2C8X9_9LACO|nr:hypothetical protein [Weissella muntiaci]TYC49883.1 hypothetical protein ESZ50_04645 [Weissella muntiaci]